MFGVLLSPLRWLERTQGRKRLALLFAYSLVITVLAAFGWRASSLNSLPDFGDPFDVKAFASYRVPESIDAFTLYRKAFTQVSEPVMSDPSFGWRAVRSGWLKADPLAKTKVDRHRLALEIWCQGTSCLLAMPVPPIDSAATDGEPDSANHMIEFGWMGLLEGTRLEEEGDLAGAWGWYNAVLRASRHVGMHSPSTYTSARLVMHSLAVDRIAPWAVNPKLDAATLRRALTDLEVVEEMSRPNSESLKADYLVLTSNFDHPERWIDSNDGESSLRAGFPQLSRLFTYFKREPERSKRVARILFAHWLAQADEPVSARPKMSATESTGNESHPDFPYYTAPGQKRCLPSHVPRVLSLVSLDAVRLTFHLLVLLHATWTRRRAAFAVDLDGHRGGAALSP